jgi:outer membrane assembly lipoprotein YfiO
MFLSKRSSALLSLLLGLCFVVPVAAQRPGEGNAIQRVQVAGQKLENLKRSVAGSLSALRQDALGDKSKTDKADPDSPEGRLKILEKDIAVALSHANSLRGRVDRSEKFEISEIEQLEITVSELQTRTDSALVDSAKLRAANVSDVGKTREQKKKKVKFLGVTVGHKADEYEELIGNVVPGRDRELFVVATKEVRKGNYDVGRLLFQTIITTYPDSPYLPMSKLAVSDSFYLEGDTSALIQASAGYQDWLTFFPTHPLADRVLLKIAECEMRQVGLPDREITHARKAEQRLRALLQQYPNSPLRPEAEKRIREVQDNLGLHNLYIANYYYNLAVDRKKGGLKGAQSRYREIIDKYPNFSYLDEALFKVGVTYLEEEETDEAAKYFQRIVRDFPNSDYVDRAKDQLKLLGAVIPEPDRTRMNVTPPESKGLLTNFKNEFFGVYPLTIDKNGVLMTSNFDHKRFELIDQIIENQGDIVSSQIPTALTTVISSKTQPQEKQ